MPKTMHPAEDDIQLPDPRKVNAEMRRERELEKAKEQMAKRGDGMFRNPLEEARRRHAGDPLRQIAYLFSDRMIPAAKGRARIVGYKRFKDLRKHLEEFVVMLPKLADPEHTERHGGSLPTGIIFHGPPGTGKTAAAKALAKALGWTFLPATGAELARDVDALNRIWAKARDLRPAIVFVDEADELLRHRELSASTEATNKLLTLMDGAADRVPDVVWIAATNHLDQLDAAMLRGGRFSENIVFELPCEQALVAHLAAWLRTRNVRLEPRFEATGLVDMLGAVSVADAEAVIQAAVNLAIGRGHTPMMVTRQDVLLAIELVMG